MKRIIIYIVLGLFLTPAIVQAAAPASIMDAVDPASQDEQIRALQNLPPDVYMRGREHIASLINTLFLAYAGVALPLFLLFATNGDQPLWFVVNSEQIAEEIIRTLVGSVGLILAVPIATALAAVYFGRREMRDITT